MTAPFRRDTLLTKPHPEPSSTVWQPCQPFGTLWRYLREATIHPFAQRTSHQKNKRKCQQERQESARVRKNPELSIELIIEHYPSRADSHFSFFLILSRCSWHLRSPPGQVLSKVDKRIKRIRRTDAWGAVRTTQTANSLANSRKRWQ